MNRCEHCGEEIKRKPVIFFAVVNSITKASHPGYGHDFTANFHLQIEYVRKKVLCVLCARKMAHLFTNLITEEIIKLGNRR